MCGLVGVMGHIGYYEKKVLQQLMLVDMLRGQHSTGIATVSPQGGVEVFKRAVNALDFYDLGRVDKTLSKPVNCVIGHNRYATKGAINNINAHPFQFDHITGAHNGTLTTTWSLDGHGEYEVDSECLYNHIDKHGVEDAFENAIGAFALTWVDSEDNTLNFLRNDQRPMSFCYSDDYQTLFWASESWMLSSILGRNNVHHTPIVKTNVNNLYTFQIPKGVMLKGDSLDSPVVKELKKKPVKKPKGSNVSSIKNGLHPYSNSVTFSNRELMLPLVGEELKVYIVGSYLDNNKTMYIEAKLEENESIVVRIYATPQSELWTTLMRSVNLFSLTAKSYKNYAGEYLLADLRTVKEVEFDIGNSDSPRDVTVEGLDGYLLTEEQFKDETASGCTWCGDPLEFGTNVLFTDDSGVFCPKCRDDAEVIDFLYGGYSHVN